MALLLADTILIVHMLFVAMVVLAVPTILLGKFMRWQWVRNRWFRGLHILGLSYVILNTWLGNICPLTIWENNLREQAGQEGYDGTFVSHWLSSLLYYDLPAWVFPVMYSGFGLLVLSLFWLVPVQWKKGDGHERFVQHP